MNKITVMTIEGKKYLTGNMTPATAAEFVADVNRAKDINTVCKKYNVSELI